MEPTDSDDEFDRRLAAANEKNQELLAKKAERKHKASVHGIRLQAIGDEHNAKIASLEEQIARLQNDMNQLASVFKVAKMEAIDKWQALDDQLKREANELAQELKSFFSVPTTEATGPDSTFSSSREHGSNASNDPLGPCSRAGNGPRTSHKQAPAGNMLSTPPHNATVTTPQQHGNVSTEVVSRGMQTLSQKELKALGLRDPRRLRKTRPLDWEERTQPFDLISPHYPTVIRNWANDAWVELRCFECGANSKPGTREFLRGVYGFVHHLKTEHPLDHCKRLPRGLGEVIAACTYSTFDNEQAEDFKNWKPGDPVLVHVIGSGDQSTPQLPESVYSATHDMASATRCEQPDSPSMREQDEDDDLYDDGDNDNDNESDDEPTKHARRRRPSLIVKLPVALPVKPPIKISLKAPVKTPDKLEATASDESTIKVERSAARKIVSM